MPHRIRCVALAGLVAAVVLLGALWAAGNRRPAADPEVARLDAMIAKLRPLQKPLGPPKGIDWLVTHPEPGQTFHQYLASRPVRPDAVRRILYVQPVGSMTPKQEEIVRRTAAFMECYFGLAVKVQPTLPLDAVPANAQRPSTFGGRQILTGYITNGLLKPRLPADAAAYIAFTAADLWPGEGWNFVFGEASLRERIGVWSLARQGDPEGGDEAWRLCLLRTMKTATHETGHMFGMWHCTAWECNMCGSNSLPESDRHPLALCPECLAKLCWCLNLEPDTHLRRVADFCAQQKLDPERQACEAALEQLKR